jgi:hypothetical protein
MYIYHKKNWNKKENNGMWVIFDPNKQQIIQAFKTMNEAMNAAPSANLIAF